MLLGIAYFVYQIDYGEFRRSLSSINWSWAIGAELAFFISQTLLATRWIVLLRVHKVYISLYQAVKLTYLGLFYNNIMPGAVGGDILKGWFITYHSHKDLRVEAAVTVFVDRLIGLTGIIFVGALAGLIVGTRLQIPLAGYTIQVRWLIWAIFVAMLLAALVFLSHRLRRLLMISHLLEKLPFASFLRKIDQAIQLYRHHTPTIIIAFLITAVIQGLSIVAVWILTQALHLDNITLVHCLLIMPIVWLISSAVPVPGGLGVMENLFIPFFSGALDPDGTMDPLSVTARVSALALFNRLMICVCSLPGALVPIFGGHLPKPTCGELIESACGEHVESDELEQAPDKQVEEL